jgi:hypothetical protein
MGTIWMETPVKSAVLLVQHAMISTQFLVMWEALLMVETTHVHVAIKTTILM